MVGKTAVDRNLNEQQKSVLLSVLGKASACHIQTRCCSLGAPVGCGTPGGGFGACAALPWEATLRSWLTWGCVRAAGGVTPAGRERFLQSLLSAKGARRRPRERSSAGASGGLLPAGSGKADAVWSSTRQTATTSHNFILESRPAAAPVQAGGRGRRTGESTLGLDAGARAGPRGSPPDLAPPFFRTAAPGASPGTPTLLSFPAPCLSPLRGAPLRLPTDNCLFLPPSDPRISGQGCFPIRRQQYWRATPSPFWGATGQPSPCAPAPSSSSHRTPPPPTPPRRTSPEPKQETSPPGVLILSSARQGQAQWHHEPRPSFIPAISISVLSLEQEASGDLKTLRLSRNICVKLLNFPKFQLGLKYYFHFLRL